ncbi:PIN domain-containing protein [Roseococcus sp. SYP-B2431]|uniref:type II toxin-antitoxin system VapC family toxin n=1 Tax=Roseococcus sp. SYP-B2431 TaxID=2496640 RepID=UPI00103E4242|nr:type II toxin-antitoxin system VapC family toxin [Roseococcus sp. SYP-B2431]TCI00111.1 PIN domain-containing protein [Roseococcus sp. SYP-B2431]
MTFVDTNILLDIIQGRSEWTEWSRQRLNERVALGPLVINDIVFSEVSVSFRHLDELDQFLQAAGIEVQRTPREGLALAAQAHLQYRRRGGSRIGVLPDFFIGAHAAIRRMPLLTRDAARYRSYFPDLMLIAPA